MTMKNLNESQDKIVGYLSEGFKSLVESYVIEYTVKLSSEDLTVSQRDEIYDMINDTLEEKVSDYLDSVLDDRVSDYLDSNLADILNERVRITFE